MSCRLNLNLKRFLKNSQKKTLAYPGWEEGGELEPLEGDAEEEGAEEEDGREEEYVRHIHTHLTNQLPTQPKVDF